MCAIQRRQQTDRQSLGVFRPVEVADLTVAPAPPEFAASQRAVVNRRPCSATAPGIKRARRSSHSR